MFDIITFGSATKDIFLRTEGDLIVKDEKFTSGEGVCFSLGSKVKIDNIYFTSGGGGTNTAVSFAKQGFSVAYCGKIGNDGAGDNILKDLYYFKVDSRFVSVTDEKMTNHSIILDVPEKDRTILIYRGASDLFSQSDISLEDLKAKWFYFAPFSFKSKDLFYLLLDYAVLSGIKVMANPSKAQLKDKGIKKALAKVDILLLNLEEASILTGITYSKEKEIMEEIKGLAKSIVLITKGKEGVIAYDGKRYYKARPFDSEVKDRTGAGDSFGAGFLSSFIRGGNIKEGIQLGVANATSCLQKIGAKHGLLKKEDDYIKVEINEFE